VAPLDVEVRLYEAALQIRKEHYRDLMERWRSIETKAQGTIATTGILIAGILAFIRELELDASTIERGLLALLLVVSVVALILSVAALRVRNVSDAPFAVSVDRLVPDVIRESNLNEEDWRDVMGEQAKLWGDTTSKLHQANESKARRVAHGQVSLTLAVILAVTFCLMRIFGLDFSIEV
jgi:hypothetical protein